jgi:hypothetical protein
MTLKRAYYFKIGTTFSLKEHRSKDSSSSVITPTYHESTAGNNHVGVKITGEREEGH